MTLMNTPARQSAPQSRLDVTLSDIDELVIGVTETSYSTNMTRQSAFQDVIVAPSESARVRDPRTRDSLYNRLLPRHYPGVWTSADAERIADIVARVTRPTVASVSRADACIRHRRHVHRIRSAGLAADIGLKEHQRNAGREAVIHCHPMSPRPPATPVCYATSAY